MTQYSEPGTDQSAVYSAYRFQFNSDCTFVATSADTSFIGSRKLAKGTTKIDESGSVSAYDMLNKFKISVNGDKLMNKLSHKWLTDKITTTEIRLRDDNAASNEILRFDK
ncbi:MAG: hypothetical protein HXX13_10840 [Bacteroidetes bacterium]|nr:hypothetical protein [Bacteroidota bacterium]